MHYFYVARYGQLPHSVCIQYPPVLLLPMYWRWRTTSISFSKRLSVRTDDLFLVSVARQCQLISQDWTLTPQVVLLLQQFVLLPHLYCPCNPLARLVRLGCNLGGWIWTGYTTTLAILGRGSKLYRCCTWVSSSSFWDRISGACALLLTVIGYGTTVGDSKSPTCAVSSAIFSGSQCHCTGGSTCCSVDWWLIGALLPIMRARKCSIACNSSWGASLWHFIAIAKLFCLDDYVNRRDSGDFYWRVIVFPLVRCAHRLCLVGGIDGTILF